MTDVELKACRDAFEKWLDSINFLDGSPNGNWVDDCYDAWQAAWNYKLTISGKE